MLIMESAYSVNLRCADDDDDDDDDVDICMCVCMLRVCMYACVRVFIYLCTNFSASYMS